MRNNPFELSINKTTSLYVFIPIISIYKHEQTYGKKTVLDIEFNSNFLLILRADYFDFMFRLLGFGIRFISYFTPN